MGCLQCNYLKTQELEDNNCLHFNKFTEGGTAILKTKQ